MRQDRQERDRGVGVLLGLGMIVGAILVIAVVGLDDDYGWPGVLLAGSSFAFGAYALFNALRD